jgi:adenylate kinase
MSQNKCAAVLLGPPGSGKTTLAESLGARPCVFVIEVGNLLEKEVQRGTPLGQQIKPFKAAGKLVPPELLERLICGALAKVRGRFVLFDGFPRAVAQIEMLFQLLEDQHLGLCAVFVLTADLQTAITRLNGRRICPNCGAVYNIRTKPPKQTGVCDRCGWGLIQREDDRMEVVRERFKIYEGETVPVIEFFKGQFGHLTWEESGTLSSDELEDRVWRRLEQANPCLPNNTANQQSQ